MFSILRISQYTKSFMSSSNANKQENLCSDVPFFDKLFLKLILVCKCLLFLCTPHWWMIYFKPSFRKSRDTSGSTSGGCLEIKERMAACLWLPAAEIWKHLRSCHLKYDNPRNKREAFLQRRTKINGSRWQELLWYRGK